MKAGLVAAADMNAFNAALEAGLSKDEAKEKARQAKAKVKLDVAVNDPVRAVFARAAHEASDARREAHRLRQEKDALLRALAIALDVSETEAWRIARLDIDLDG